MCNLFLIGGVVCLFVLPLFNGFQITYPAEWFIFVLLAQQYALIVAHGTMGDVGLISAFHTNGMHFGHVIGNGAKSRNRSFRSIIFKRTISNI